MNSIDNFERLREKSPLIIETSNGGKVKKIKVMASKISNIKKEDRPDLRESLIEKSKKQETYIKQLEN